MSAIEAAEDLFSRPLAQHALFSGDGDPGTVRMEIWRLDWLAEVEFPRLVEPAPIEDPALSNDGKGDR